LDGDGKSCTLFSAAAFSIDRRNDRRLPRGVKALLHRDGEKALKYWRERYAHRGHGEGTFQLSR
jgi:hypothetical protein